MRKVKKVKPVPLSVLVDQCEPQSGRRDRHFVRAFAAWLHEHAERLRFDVVERLALRDVVVTFQMKRRLELVITGYPPEELPGAVTLTIGEEEFPRVEVWVEATARPDPYQLCTLDYSVAGQPVLVSDGPHHGARGTLVVSATIGAGQEARVCLEDGSVVTVAGEHLQPIT